MRVGIDVTCWCNRRGFGRFTRELVTALIKLPVDDEYVLLTDRQTAESADFPEPCRIAIADTSAAVSQAASADGRRSVRDVWAMRCLVNREALDVMFFPAVYSYFPVRSGIPCIVTFHDVIAESLPRKVFRSWRSQMFWRLKCKLALHRASHIVTVSLASKEALIRYFNLSSDQVSIISEAPSEVFANTMNRINIDGATLKRHGLEPGKRYILYVGGISPHKNLDVLIEAFAAVRSDPQTADMQLVLVGDYAGDVFNTCYKHLCMLVNRCGLQQAVHFTGFVPDEDLVHIYTACEAFVLPSYLEGFGLPAVEAMACGAPVVASNRGSLPEVLNGAGELFDPHDVATLIDCLKRILRDPVYQRELQTRSLQRALDFSWEKSARQMRNIFDTMKA
jgi:glycosyltransferase involved in cell wall biosynthesis